MANPLSEKLDYLIDEFNFFDFCAERDLFFDDAERTSATEKLRAELVCAGELIAQACDSKCSTNREPSNLPLSDSDSADLRRAAQFLKARVDVCLSSPAKYATAFYEILSKAAKICRGNRVTLHYTRWLRNRERGQTHVHSLIKRYFREGKQESVAMLVASQLKRMAFPQDQPDPDCYEVAKAEFLDYQSAAWMLAACTPKFKAQLGMMDEINKAVELLTYDRERLIEEEHDERIVARPLDSTKMEAARFTVEQAYSRLTKLRSEFGSPLEPKARAEKALEISASVNECYAELNSSDLTLDIFLEHAGRGKRRCLGRAKLTNDAYKLFSIGISSAREKSESDSDQVSLILTWSQKELSKVLMDVDLTHLDDKQRTNLRQKITRIRQLVTFINDKSNDGKPLRLLANPSTDGSRSSTTRFRYQQSF